MAALKKLIAECVTLSANLSPAINAASYLSQLSEDPRRSENNYDLFMKFAGLISNSVLGILYRLGHFGGDKKLLDAAAEIILMREALQHEEVDVGGYAAYLLASHRRMQLRGSYFISYTFNEKK